MSGPHLVNTPDANSFRELSATTAGRRVLFGDTENLPPQVHGYVRKAENALVAGQDKTKRLVDDPTKTDVVKHETARAIAYNTTSEIEDSQIRMNAFGLKLIEEGQGEIESQFELKPGFDLSYNRIIDYINTQASKPDGIAKIREAMKQDINVVAVLKNYKPYQFELTAENRKSLMLDGCILHAREASEKVATGQAVVDVAAKYGRVTRGVDGSFYNKAMAAQASKRVDP